MTPAGSNKPRDRGFTLIELLIALAIISLITLLLFSGLRLGSRAWESVERISGQTADLRLINGFLTETLVQIRAASTTVDAESRTIFGGDTERFECVAPLSTHVGLAGLYILRLTLEGHGDHRALVLTRWLLHPQILAGGDGFPPWEPLEKDETQSLDEYPVNMDAAGGAFGRTLLLEDVETISIAYYGFADGETEADWYEDWFERSNMPILLSITLATSSQSWPDISVALPVLQM